AIHILYRRGDEATWGRGIALRRTKQALAWLESIYGPYAYPQLTNVHRLEGGGTEFPMMIMDGSPSQGLILHEAGHQFTYAILANNEWASAWMDEGLSDYQTQWAERLTRADRHRPAEGPQIPISRDGIYPPRPQGYRSLAATPLPGEREDIRLDSLDLMHRAQPIGWSANKFSEFGIYNSMVYSRAVRMYGALRDVMGETAWREFLHRYYERWKFKHVDELAMRTEASRAAGRDLSWFFDEWLRRVGLIEYALGGWTAAPDGDGWISNVTVVRRGPYLHPMPVAIRTADGFTFGRSEPLRDPDTVRVRTRLKPLDVRLDPNHVTEDWWRFDDADVTAPWFDERTARVVFDWPLLHQWREDRFVTAFLPYGWYSDPGHFTPALRMSINYQGWLDRITLGLATPTAPGIRGRSHLQGWFTLHDPAVGAKISPQIGVSDWALDGIDKFVLDRTWNATPFVYANGPQRTVTLAFTSTVPYDPTFFDPTRWEGHTVLSVSGTGELRTPLPDTVRLRAFLAGGFVSGTNATRGYIRADASATRVWATPDGAHTIGIRGFASYDARAPIERAVFLSANDPTETFADDFLRPEGAPLARSDVHYTSLGGAGLRGYDPRLAVPAVVAVNAEATTRLFSLADSPRALGAYLGAFADAATTFHSGPIVTPALAAILPAATRHEMTSHLLADAGVGMALRGYVYDQDVAIRVDIPFLVAQPLLAAGRSAGSQVAAWRWTFSFNDLW
ncbi:MAG TPA: M1 family aminopeptidase, partial [Gemmatimonadaceae bacterium]|nr:M1 family aminopeptidase [Gemmatimonadaceae bacterium]